MKHAFVINILWATFALLLWEWLHPFEHHMDDFWKKTKRIYVYQEFSTKKTQIITNVTWTTFTTHHRADEDKVGKESSMS